MLLFADCFLDILFAFTLFAAAYLIYHFVMFFYYSLHMPLLRKGPNSKERQL